MSPELYPFMVFLWKSILIEVAFSPLDFGEASIMLWELISPLVQLSIHSLVVKSKGLTKFLKTCSELVLYHSERIGRSVRPDMRYCSRSRCFHPDPGTKHISVPPRHMT